MANSGVSSLTAFTGSGTSSGTNTGDQTITLTGGVTGGGTGTFAATVITNADLTGVVTSIGNATSIGAGAITNTMLATVYEQQSNKNIANGYAGLDVTGKILKLKST